MDPYIGEWCSYNFASLSLHTKKLCSRLFSTEVEFNWQKQPNRVFSHFFGGLRGNGYGLSMARWKARGRLPISANWTFFASSHGWGAMSKYWSKLWFLKGAGSLRAQISGWRGRPPTSFGIGKLESLSYHVVLFAWSYVYPFWYNASVWHTDRHAIMSDIRASLSPRA